MTSARKKPRPEKNDKERSIDREVEQSFPASDPPSYSGGVIGEPSRPRKDEPHSPKDSK